MLKNLVEKIENLFAAKIPEEQTGSNPDFDPQVHAARVLKWQANNARKKPPHYLSGNIRLGKLGTHIPIADVTIASSFLKKS